MDCDVLSRYADLYLDGELAFEERAEIEAHLKQCEVCRGSVTGEVRLRKRIRESLLSARAPSSLRDHVARRLQEERSRLQRPRFLPTVTYAVAILTVVVLGYSVIFMMDQASDPVDGAVAAHVASSDTEIYGTTGQVHEFLRKNAPFEYRVPLEDREGVKLVGARVAHLGSTPAVVYLYDMEGKRISVAQYRSADEMERPELRMDRRSGFVVATYGDGQLTHTVVGDIPEPEVKRFIPASYTP